MVFIFIFTELPQTESCLLQECLVFSLDLSLIYSWSTDVLRWSSMWKGEEGKQPGMTPTPIPFHALPGASHIHLGREEGRFFFIPYNLTPNKTCQGIKPSYSVIFREHGKGPFLFLKQKGL